MLHWLLIALYWRKVYRTICRSWSHMMTRIQWTIVSRLDRWRSRRCSTTQKLVNFQVDFTRTWSVHDDDFLLFHRIVVYSTSSGTSSAWQQYETLNNCEQIVVATWSPFVNLDFSMWSSWIDRIILLLFIFCVLTFRFWHKNQARLA